MKHYYTQQWWKQMLLLSLIVFIFSKPVFSQVGTPSYFTVTPTTSTNAFPLNTTTSNKVQWIYGPGSFTSAGNGSGTPVGAGNNITKLYIRIQTVNAATVYTPNFIISMGQASSTFSNGTTSTATVFANGTYVTGLTTVYSSTSFSFTGLTTANWYGITLQTPFTYDPTKSLVIEVKSNLTTAGGNSVNSITGTGNQRIFGAYASATGTGGAGLTPMGVDILPNTPCTSPPTPGTSTSTASTVCPSTNFTLNLTGNSTGSGQTYQWQSSPTIGFGSPTNVGSSQTSSSLITSAVSTLYYRCGVTCSANTQYSTPVLVTVNSSFTGGTYTIDNTIAASSTNFTSFSSAVSAMACGITGPVIFNVNGASGPYNEQVVMPVISGTSATNTITFNGNGVTLTFASSNSAIPSTLELGGTDYCRFNNINFVGTGTTYAFAAHLWNGADNNQFTNCTFTVPANTSTTTVVPFSISGSQNVVTTTGVAGINNVITGCTMNSGYYNTVFTGNSASPATGNQLINCNIKD